MRNGVITVFMGAVVQHMHFCISVAPTMTCIWEEVHDWSSCLEDGWGGGGGGGGWISSFMLKSYRHIIRKIVELWPNWNTRCVAKNAQKGIINVCMSGYEKMDNSWEMVVSIIIKHPPPPFTTATTVALKIICLHCMCLHWNMLSMHH